MSRLHKEQTTVRPRLKKEIHDAIRSLAESEGKSTNEILAELVRERSTNTADTIMSLLSDDGKTNHFKDSDIPALRTLPTMSNKELVQKAAEISGRSVLDIILDGVKMAAKQVLRDHELYKDAWAANMSAIAVLIKNGATIITPTSINELRCSNINPIKTWMKLYQPKIANDLKKLYPRFSITLAPEGLREFKRSLAAASAAGEPSNQEPPPTKLADGEQVYPETPLEREGGKPPCIG